MPPAGARHHELPGPVAGAFDDERRRAGLAESPRRARRARRPKFPEARGARPLLNSRGAKIGKWLLVEWILLRICRNSFCPVGRGFGYGIGLFNFILPPEDSSAPRRRLQGATAETSACALHKVRIGPETPRRSFRPPRRSSFGRRGAPFGAPRREGRGPAQGPGAPRSTLAAGGGAGSRQDEVAQYNAAATAVMTYRENSGEIEGKIRLTLQGPSPRARSPGPDYAGPLSH